MLVFGDHMCWRKPEYSEKLTNLGWGTTILNMQVVGNKPGTQLSELMNMLTTQMLVFGSHMCWWKPEYPEKLTWMGNQYPQHASK